MKNTRTDRIRLQGASIVPSPKQSATYYTTLPVPVVPATITTDGSTFDVPPNRQYYFYIASSVSSFTLTLDSVPSVTFTNVFDPTNFANCKLTVAATGSLSASTSEVSVTDSFNILNTSNGEIYTFTYFNTGSVIAGFATGSAPLPAPDSSLFLSSIVPTTSSTSFVPAGSSTSGTTSDTLSLSNTFFFTGKEFGTPRTTDRYVYVKSGIPDGSLQNEFLYSRGESIVASGVFPTYYLDELFATPGLESQLWNSVGPYETKYPLIQDWWESQFNTVLFLKIVDYPYIVQWVYKSINRPSSPFTEQFRLVSNWIDLRTLPDFTVESNFLDWIKNITITPYSPFYNGGRTDLVTTWTAVDPTDLTPGAVPTSVGGALQAWADAFEIKPTL